MGVGKYEDKLNRYIDFYSVVIGYPSRVSMRFNWLTRMSQFNLIERRTKRRIMPVQLDLYCLSHDT